MTEENITKKTNKGKIVGIVISAVGMLCVIAVILLFVVPLNQTTKKITVELGDEISTDLNDYVSGFMPGFWVTKLDVSEVNTSSVGIYTAIVKHGFQEFNYEVTVQDTTPPTITLLSGNVYLKEGETYPVSYFVEDSFDLGGEVTVTVSDVTKHNIRRGYVYSDKSGEYSFDFYAKDESGNEAVYTLVVTVDTPPTITGMKNYYVAPGTTLDYLEFIEAVDEVDGDVTVSVYTDATDVDLSTVGEYELIYICEDSYGLSSSETVNVNVLESMEIQNLINTHKINRFDEIIVGAYNLYDIGCYEDKTMKEMLEIMNPTIVRIETPIPSNGSGFILEITDDEIIIGTNQHVVKKYENLDVYFFDGTKVKGKVIDTLYDYDMGFMSVKRADISEELLDKLYTVHINKGYWDALNNEADLAMGVRCITNDGKVWKERTGRLVYKSGVTDLMWRSIPQVTRVSVSLFHGASGSNVFDIHGNMMGIATYIITGAGRYESYCIPLDVFCEKYEKVFGRKPYYY